MKPAAHILLVEDDDLDAFIAIHMLSNACKDCKITRFTNGQEAVNFLKSKDLLTPIVIVLDLNMPLMNGLQFLEEISQSNKLKKLTITVLSSSSNPSDIAFCEDFGVSKFYIKPLTEKSSIEIIDLAKVA